MWTYPLAGGTGPKYLALVDAIEQAIQTGKLQPNERLPTNRELTQLFDVTIATVTKAMAVAARKGLVSAQVGSGTYVRDVAANVETPQKTFDLALNVLPEGVVEKELLAMVQPNAQALLSRGMFGYGSYVPTAQHAQAAAGWVEAFGGPARPEDVLLTVGVHQGLMAALHAVQGPGQHAVCEALSYTGIKRIADFLNVSLSGAECDEAGMRPDSLEQLLRQTKARVVIVTSTLHNPTTATLPLERRKAIAGLCKKYDACLIEDGVNMPLVASDTASVSSFAPERSIFLTGFSKCVASGFRLGYAVTPPGIKQAFHEALVSTQWIGPRLYAGLAEQLLNMGALERCIQAHRVEARFRFDLASRILKGVRPVATPSYHAWVDAPADQPGDSFAAHALRLGVKISPAAHFAVSDSAAVPAAYRISLGATQDRDELERALHILASMTARPPGVVSTLV